MIYVVDKNIFHCKIKKIAMKIINKTLVAEQQRATKLSCCRGKGRSCGLIQVSQTSYFKIKNLVLEGGKSS